MGYLKKGADGSLLYSVVNAAEPDADGGWPLSACASLNLCSCSVILKSDLCATPAVMCRQEASSGFPFLRTRVPPPPNETGKWAEGDHPVGVEALVRPFRTRDLRASSGTRAVELQAWGWASQYGREGFILHSGSTPCPGTGAQPHPTPKSLKEMMSAPHAF